MVKKQKFEIHFASNNNNTYTYISLNWCASFIHHIYIFLDTKNCSHFWENVRFVGGRIFRFGGSKYVETYLCNCSDRHHIAPISFWRPYSVAILAQVVETSFQNDTSEATLSSQSLNTTSMACIFLIVTAAAWRSAFAMTLPSSLKTTSNRYSRAADELKRGGLPECAADGQ